MLTVAGLSKSFGGRELFDDVSLNIMAGDRIAITGPNGAGKSTLIKIILGQEEPDAGSVSFIRGTRVGYLPQESEPAGNGPIKVRDAFRCLGVESRIGKGDLPVGTIGLQGFDLDLDVTELHEPFEDFEPVPLECRM